MSNAEQATAAAVRTAAAIAAVREASATRADLARQASTIPVPRPGGPVGQRKIRLRGLGDDPAPAQAATAAGPVRPHGHGKIRRDGRAR